MGTFPGTKSKDSRFSFWLGLLARSGLGIQGRFLLLVAGVITAIVLAFSWFFVHRERAIIETELFKRAQSLASNLAFNSTLGVLIRDTSGLSELASGIARSEDDIVYAMIVDKDGTILGHSLSARVNEVIEIPADMTGFVSDADMQGEGEESQDYLVHFIMPVERVKQDLSREEILLPGDDMGNLSGPYAQGRNGEVEEIGRAVVGVSLLGMQSMVAQLKLMVAVLAAIIGTASIFAVYGMARAVAIPIKRLVAATEKVAAGDLSHMVEAKGRDEVAELAHSFNHMIVDLRKYHEEVEDYSRTLEDKVSERTTDLEEANKSLKDTQAQLIQASKMAAMGQFRSRCRARAQPATCRNQRVHRPSASEAPGGNTRVALRQENRRPVREDDEDSQQPKDICAPVQIRVCGNGHQSAHRRCPDAPGRAAPVS